MKMTITGKKLITFCRALLILTTSMAMYAVSDKEPRVMLLFPWRGTFLGGLAIHHRTHHELFTKNSLYTMTLTLNNVLAQELSKMGLPVEISKRLITEEEILDCCQRHAINVAVTPDIFLLPMLYNVSKQRELSIIYMRHATVDDLLEKNIHLLKGVDYALGVNPSIVEYLTTANTEHGLGIRSIDCMPPFWDEAACKNSCPRFKDKTSFFNDRFGLTVRNDDVVVCMVANFVLGKNHILALKAFQELVHNRGYGNIHLIFAGDGILRAEIESSLHERNLEGSVHMVGSIPDVVSLLHYSDIHILPSVAEGFPLANLEAAYLKKAIVTTAGIGASYLIEHGVTGLLFEKNNEIDLAHALEVLINDAPLRAFLGNQVHERVASSFMNKNNYDRWQNCLRYLGYDPTSKKIE